MEFCFATGPTNYVVGPKFRRVKKAAQTCVVAAVISRSACAMLVQLTELEDGLDVSRHEKRNHG